MHVLGAYHQAAVTQRREPARVALAQGFARFPAVTTAAATPASATMPLTSLDGLLAAQAVDDPAQRRRRALRRGSQVLDELERVRDALLDGVLPGAVLHRLMSLVAHEEAELDDPNLAAVLRDIELRAAVEAVKLERAGAAESPPTRAVAIGGDDGPAFAQQ